jgi:hypothetical protein
VAGSSGGAAGGVMASNAAATVATAGGATSKNHEPTWPPWSLARDQVVFSASRGEGRRLEIVVLRDGPGDNDWALDDRPVLRNGDRVHVLKVPAADDEFVQVCPREHSEYPHGADPDPQFVGYMRRKWLAALSRSAVVASSGGAAASSGGKAASSSGGAAASGAAASGAASGKAAVAASSGGAAAVAASSGGVAASGKAAAAASSGAKVPRYQALPDCNNLFSCGFGCKCDGEFVQYRPALSGKVPSLPSGPMAKHYRAKHPNIGGYAMKKGNAATRVMYRRVGEKGVEETQPRRFGVHAPGCTADRRICSTGMVECPDDELHTMSRRVKQLINDTYRPEEFEHDGMDFLNADLSQDSLNM